MFYIKFTRHTTFVNNRVCVFHIIIRKQQYKKESSSRIDLKINEIYTEQKLIYTGFNKITTFELKRYPM
jgi:CRISPR/Cas system CMR-associated protein Cmr3 (group 5 of RAMP superfamily)